MDKEKNKTMSLVSILMLIGGFTLILVSILMSEVLKWPPYASGFCRDLGLLLSAVVSGSIVHEKLLRDAMFDEWRGELRVHAQEAALVTHKLFCDKPPGMTGLSYLSPHRRNFPRYYDWVNVMEPQDLFFAGRSVLHRIDADIRDRDTKSSAEAVLFRRLLEGCKITILFLDPRIDIIDRLAREEGQQKDAMLANIATSIGICKRLHDLLRNTTVPPTAQITIRIYDAVPYFAYHSTTKEQKTGEREDDIIVGFYFLSDLGSTSAAYEVVDQNTRDQFRGHFVTTAARARDTTLLEVTAASDRRYFNEELYLRLCSFLAKELSETIRPRLS